MQNKDFPLSQDESAILLKKGIALHKQGQIADAQEIYERLIASEPKQFDALNLLGVIAYQSYNYELAVELIGKALEINPHYSAAHTHLGLAMARMKRYEDAIASYNRALAIKPDSAEAYANRGSAFEALGHLELAVESYDRAIEIKADYAEAYFSRGNALKNLNCIEEAIHSYERAISYKSKYAEAYSNLGVTLRILKRYEDALVSYECALAIKPEYAEAYANRGNVLQDLKRLEKAIESYDRAIAIKNDYVEAYVNRGTALQALKQVKVAVESYDNAIAIQPDYVDAHWNKSLGLLLAGDFTQGWELYEWRWEAANTAKNMRHLTKPLWLGNEDIGGKTLLLHAEQGLGDTIQFCRYAKLIADLGAKVTLEVPKALVGLLNGLEGVDTLIEKDQILPAYDYHCPLMSLPLAFKTELHTIPSPGTYLYADAIKRDEWCKRLGAPKNLRVGLVWSGSTGHKNDHNRSLTLEELLPYLPKGYEYISLQKEVRTEDRARLASSNIRYFGERLKDFSDTAALCALMDVVISVDTSVAHLAGALGKTTWVLLPYAPDWRWLLDRNDSPWYASIKLYRQGKEIQWAPVLERVAKELLKK